MTQPNDIPAILGRLDAAAIRADGWPLCDAIKLDISDPPTLAERFAAQAPTDIRALCAEVLALREERDALTERTRITGVSRGG